MATNWIVSRRFDLAFFIGSVAVSFLFLALYVVLHKWFHLSLVTAGIVVNGIFLYGIDQPHIFQTASRVYGDAEQFRKTRLLSTWGFTLLVFAAIGVTAYGGSQQFEAFFDLFGAFHIIRQNVGLIKAYMRLNNDMNPLNNRIDLMVYYIGMFACVLREFAGEGELLPEWVGGLSMWLTWLAILFFVYWQYRIVRRGGKLNIPKLLLMGATLATHYLIFYVVAIPMLATVMDTAYHDVQYHGWMAHYQQKKFPQVKDVARKWLFASAAFGAIAFLLSLIKGTAGLYVHNIQVAIVMFHYVMDGFIWRFRGDPALARMLLGAN